MRILVVSNLYPPFTIGGYEMNCANVVGELRARGHEVVVATAPSHVPGPPDPPHVRRCLRMSAHVPAYAHAAAPQAWLHACDISDFDNVAALQRLLVVEAPDIVFFWNTHGIGTLHLIDFLNVHGVPWASYLGDRVFEQMVNAAPRHVRAIFQGHDPAYFASGGIMAVSQHLVDEITSLGGFAFPRPPTIVHGYAIVSDSPVAREYRRDGRLRFMAAGRVSEHKGTTLICDAVARLAAEGVGGFEVDLYGEGEVAFYVNYANALGIADRVTFHGGVPQPRLHEQFQTHDLFLFPTWSREPFAFAPFEAAAYGCVPILTADCGCSERIVDGVHGIKIERTAEALAAAMRQAVEGRIPLERIGAAGAAMARRDLSLAGHVDKLLAVLSEQCRPWERADVADPRALLVAFVKHNLSLAFRFGATD
jgi:glycosyltransferase involved in cell wall biosynthesis